MTVEAVLANHGARIAAAEQGVSRVEGNLSKLVWFMMGTFATSAGALVAILIKR